jgi:hypothetical protein
MNIYSHTPYTYRIHWTTTGMNYYGVRYANGCHPSDFWVTYFTSSKKVSEYRKTHGDPDVIEIRKTFTSDNKINESREFETKVLQRLKVHKRSDYLNVGINKGIPPMFGNDNPMNNPEVKAKFLQVVTSDEHRHKQSLSVKQRVSAGKHHFLGKSINKTRVENGTHQFLGGKIQGETSRKKVKDRSHNFLFETQRQLENGTHTSQVKWSCEHCGKEGNGSTNYKRWHGINCRSLSVHQDKK